MKIIVKLVFVIAVFAAANFAATFTNVSAADVAAPTQADGTGDGQPVGMIIKWYNPCEELSEGASQEEQDEWDDQDRADVQQHCPPS